MIPVDQYMESHIRGRSARRIFAEKTEAFRRGEEAPRLNRPRHLFPAIRRIAYWEDIPTRDVLRICAEHAQVLDSDGWCHRGRGRRVHRAHRWIVTIDGCVIYRVLSQGYK